MNILAIDSSNLVMGVAVMTDGRLLAELTTNNKKNHSERLMPAIRQVLASAGLKPGDIDRFAVARGPGSYTGLRIGVTVAKMMAWSLQKELVGVSSLEIVAQNARYFDGLIAPFFDARRGRVFAGVYANRGSDIQQIAPDRIIPVEDWLSELAEVHRPVLFLSNDLTQWAQRLKSSLDGAIIGCGAQNIPRAAELAALAARRKPETDIHHFLPTYLRLAEAEANWLAKQER